MKTPEEFEEAVMRTRGLIKKPPRNEPVRDYERRNRERGSVSPLGGQAVVKQQPNRRQ
jgi:hypothetical protein